MSATPDPSNAERRDRTRARSDGEVGADETARANRRWWDAAADDYQAEHGDVPRRTDRRGYLGPGGPATRPTRTCSADADLAGRRVLEVGCGAAQCARWLAGQGAVVVALRPLGRPARARPRRSTERTGVDVPARAGRRLRASRSRTPASTSPSRAFGAMPFVADSAAAMREVAGCCGPAAGSSSRSRTRCAGRSRRSRARRPDRQLVVLRPHARTSRWTPTGGRPTSSTTAPSATGSARSSPPGSCWPTSSSRSGRPGTRRCGAAGHRCAATVPGHRDLRL